MKTKYNRSQSISMNLESKKLIKAGLLGFCFFLGYTAHTQISEVTRDTLSKVLIKSTRIGQELSRTPRSVHVDSYDPLTNDLNPVNINQYLEEIPGVFATNGYNYAQDMRLSIRGFGARSAFGIRGVKLIVDGIPETTPDGQGQVDNIDISAITRVESLRGAASSLYGNASGGVLAINTMKDFDETFATANFQMGSFGMNKVDVSAGLKEGQNRILLRANHQTFEGYREHSEAKQTNWSARWLRYVEDGEFDILVNYTNSPEANDPGGVNLEQATTMPTTARDANLFYDAGESIEQFKISGRYTKKLFNDWTLSSYGFFSIRDFKGYLPFENSGYIDLYRSYGGAGINLSYQKIYGQAVNNLQIGYDIGWQYDDRERYDNLQGSIGGLVFDQQERFNAVGVYLYDHIDWQKWSLDIGLRYDDNRLEAEDHILTNGDGSDQLEYHQLNPNIGVLRQLSDKSSIYFQLATSFETPTLSELSADPSGTEGFNEELAPQKALSLELGFRQSYGFGAVSIAAFRIKTEDEIIPYELEAFPGRDFFRNAGSTERWGVEIDNDMTVGNYVTWASSYSFSDFSYDDYVLSGTDLAGNKLPGIPIHRLTNSLKVSPVDDAMISIQSLYTGRIYANDRNAVEIEPVHLINLSASYTIETKRIDIHPVIGVNNLLGTDYYSNIRINAFGSRFYEAGPTAQVYAGARFTIR